MALDSSIEWTEATWNPVTGCTKISDGCKHCYAERMSKRLQAMGQPNYRHGFRVQVHENSLENPLRWKKPRMVFVNSMSDLFHEKVPVPFIQSVFNIMHEASWHTFQILTKRSSRLADIANSLNWCSNIWVGVSVENSKNLYRVQDLLNVPAEVRFLSLEPLLGPLPELELTGISWVIVGGESGPGARPLKKHWVVDIRDRCKELSMPFFFKQWGGVRKKKNGREIDGRTWDEMPVFV